MAKGVGIIAVVALHVSGRASRLFHMPYSNGWWTLTWINRFVNFCVPLFLIISAILLARGAAAQEKPDWRRFALRRLRSVLLPLILWSIIYWAFKAVLQQNPKMATASYWMAVRPRLFELFFGKAEFHLYFLSVLAQLCILLPFCVIAFKRLRLNIWLVLLIAIILQALAVIVQKLIVFTYPASTFYWYLWAFLPAIWIGCNWRSWPELRKQTWPLWALLAVGGFAVFGYESYLDLLKRGPNGTLMNAATWAYALGMSFLILSLLTIWRSGGTPLRRGLKGLGEMSLQIYLMHPLLMQFLSKPSRIEFFKSLPLPSLWFFLITLFGTYAVGLILNQIPYVNGILFGRDFPKRKKPATESAAEPVSPAGS